MSEVAGQGLPASLTKRFSQLYAERACCHRISFMIPLKGVGPTALIGEQGLAASRRRESPRLHGTRTCSPRAGTEFLVVGGRISRANHQKQFLREKSTG